MIYVTADPHGWPLPDFLGLLKKAGFGEDDFLYVLGDVIDRGEDGVSWLLWLTQMPNAQLILGNHEAMLLSCRFLFGDVNEENLDKLNLDHILAMQSWLQNGGRTTLEGLKDLLKRDPELLEGIWDYLDDCPLYEWAEAGGRKFLLVHGGLPDYREGRPVESCTADDLLWGRPDRDSRYDSRFHTILGHTPTALLDPACEGKALKTETWTDLDTGSPTHAPMLLRLEDMREFYLE